MMKKPIAYIDRNKLASEIMRFFEMAPADVVVAGHAVTLCANR